MLLSFHIKYIINGDLYGCFGLLLRAPIKHRLPNRLSISGKDRAELCSRILDGDNDPMKSAVPLKSRKQEMV